MADFEDEAAGWVNDNLSTTFQNVGGDVVARDLIDIIASTFEPLQISPPSVSGIPQVGNTLTGVHGSYTTPPATYTYQWFVGGLLVVGATSPTYVVQLSDAGKVIRFEETPTNSAGSGLVSVSANVSIL